MKFEDQVFNYTYEFCTEIGADIDSRALKNGIERHLASARNVVTEATLERLGHQQVAVMINTAARYKITLAEVLMEGLRNGIQATSVLCSELRARKEGGQRIHRRPSLRVVTSQRPTRTDYEDLDR